MKGISQGYALFNYFCIVLNTVRYSIQYNNNNNNKYEREERKGMKIEIKGAT